MNPPTLLHGAPHPSSSYNLLLSPCDPYLNINPNFFHSHLNNPNHPPSTATNHPVTLPPPKPPQSTDLPTTFSTLKELIHQSETAAQSLRSLLQTTSSSAATAASDNAFCTCPFNLHHLIPPESLFRHSLKCPSSRAPALNLDLLHLESLRYPHTLQSSHELIKQNCFVQTLGDPSAELCFSLDEYCQFGPNFFYRDCPGVFGSNDQDGSNRTFTMPGILSVECANFVGSGNGESKDLSSQCLRLLPSELWFVRNEIEGWSDYPTTYSFSVLRAFLCCFKAQDSDFWMWVIANSPRYGVVIDVPLRDHIILLFRLCLKAIVSEANRSADSVMYRITRELNPATMAFECPIGVQVLKWLSFQLSVLYGEVNGKLFAINMLKQWMSNASLNSLSPLTRRAAESPSLTDVDGKSVVPSEKSVVREGTSVSGESSNSRVIFVSQVAAAVGALHERSLLEEKIKALQYSQSLTNYQQMAEHAYFSKRADEERQKRSNYRPLLEHDGFLWQRPHNQETNKSKTREELLAEERDYKRRRMSYRGKKSKRSKTQVMKDIIEEYMEEITQAGGIGCFAKGVEEAGKFTSERPLFHDMSTDVDGPKKNVCDFTEIISERPHGYKKQLESHNKIRSAIFECQFPEDHKRHRRDSSRPHEHQSRRSVDRDRRDRECYSKSPDRQRSNGSSCAHVSNRRDRDDVEQSIKSYSPDSSHRWSHERTNHQRQRGDRNTDMKDRRQRHAYGDDRSASVTSHEFEDRYDPSATPNIYEDNVSFG